MTLTVNVLGDCLVHAWLQDVIVGAEARVNSVGQGLVAEARAACVAANTGGCTSTSPMIFGPLYLERCGFTPATAGLMRLA